MLLKPPGQVCSNCVFFSSCYQTWTSVRPSQDCVLEETALTQWAPMSANVPRVTGKVRPTRSVKVRHLLHQVQTTQAVRKQHTNNLSPIRYLLSHTLGVVFDIVRVLSFWYAWNVDVRSENPVRIAWNQSSWWFMLVSGLASWLFSSLGPSLTLNSAVWVEFKQCRVKTNRRVVKRGSAVLGFKPAL